MIEKYYAAHIKISPGVTAIDVMRPSKNKKTKEAIQNAQASQKPFEEQRDV